MIARIPKAYGYVRVSHQNQIDKDESVPRQIARTESDWQLNLEPKGVLWGGVEHEGAHVSAFKKPFYKRKAGMRLLEKMSKGDYLIVDRVDRICRGVKDWVGLKSLLSSMGVHLRILDCYGVSFQEGTPMGDFMMNLFVSIAQLESQNISHRIKGAIAFKKSQGFWTSGKQTPWGCALVRTKGGKLLVWSPEKRAEMSRIVQLHDEDGLSFDKIATKLAAEELGIDDEKAKSAFVPGKYQRMHYFRRYRRELFYRELEQHDPDLKPINIDWGVIDKLGGYCNFEEYLAAVKEKASTYANA